MAGSFSWRHMEPLDWVLLLCVGASVLCILAFVTMVFVGRYRIPRKDSGAGAAREDQTDLIAFRIAAPLCVMRSAPGSAGAVDGSTIGSIAADRAYAPAAPPAARPRHRPRSRCRARPVAASP